MNKLGLCIFSSTKGHFDQRDIYAETLRDLNDQIPLVTFTDALAHIKVGPEGSEEEMKVVFRDYEVRPYTTEGKFKHFDQSHADEYTKDICRMAKLIRAPYVLLLEDDWVFRGGDLQKYIREGVQMLEDIPELLCMRFPHELYDASIFKSFGAVYSPLNLDFQMNNYFYSLNPNIVRSRDLQIVCEIIESLGNKLSPLIEWKFTQAFNILSQGKGLFGAFLPTEIRARHIGLANWHQVLADINKEHE